MKRIGILACVCGIAALVCDVDRVSAEGRPLERMSPELRARTERAIERGLAFLKSTQLPDGGWRGSQDSDPAITALVADCFARQQGFGADHEIVRRAFEFVLRFAQPDGGIYAPDGGIQNYQTSIALMALSTSKDEGVRKAAADARKYLTDLQIDEGDGYQRDNVFYGGAGYGHEKRPDLSNTQMMLEALHESGLSPENPVYKKAMVFVSRCQMLPKTNDRSFAAGGDGGFIYSPANGGESKAGLEDYDGGSRLRSYGSMTYSGFKSMLYAQIDHSDPRVRAAFEWIRKHYTLDENPNMPGEMSRQGLYYYYLVFARGLDAWGADSIQDAAGVQHDWRQELCTKLIELQRDDGSWVNEERRWLESNPYLVTAYSVRALQTCLR